MNEPISLAEKFAHTPGDTEEVRFLKKLIFIVSTCCCVCGLLWGALYYWFLGPGLTMLLPWLFVIVVGCTIPVAHFLRKYRLLVYAQLIGITWITAFIQWSLGSLHDSGLVIAWSFLGPIGALVFLPKKQAIFWMVQFLCVVCITVLFEPRLSGDSVRSTSAFRSIFYLMNLCASTLVVFFTSYYFVTNLVKQKQLSNELNVELHDTLEDLKCTQKQLIENEKLAAFGTAASRMAHEIQNPLNFVNNFSTFSEELVLSIESSDTPESEKKEDMELLKETLRKISFHGKRASGIITELQGHTVKGTAEDFFRKKDSFADK